MISFDVFFSLFFFRWFKFFLFLLSFLFLLGQQKKSPPHAVNASKGSVPENVCRGSRALTNRVSCSHLYPIYICLKSWTKGPMTGLGLTYFPSVISIEFVNRASSNPLVYRVPSYNSRGFFFPSTPTQNSVRDQRC